MPQTPTKTPNSGKTIKDQSNTEKI
uniref:Uncharacterized protein n=1 Tax=Rhizophora mucronata TaxID=61149 RepID=A0A2P2LLE1_RHIMU